MLCSLNFVQFCIKQQMGAVECGWWGGLLVVEIKLYYVRTAQELLERVWRRGQDSNLHSLSAGGFQDRCTTIMRPLRKMANQNIAQTDVGDQVRPRVSVTAGS